MTLLTVSNLSKKYDSKPVVNNINFHFQSNKCIALIGPNGAGKTTILRTLAGLLHPTTGTAQFEDMKSGDDIRKHIGYLPQHPVFYSWMTGREFLIYCGELGFLSKKEAQYQADLLFDKVGIADAKDKRISKYSGGMRQRLGIAQAIIHKPKLLLLDEPVSSLDPIGRREVLTMMEELKNEMSILFSTHILSDAEAISDELLLLHQGEIVESGSMDTLRQKYQTDKIELGFQSDPGKYKARIDNLPAVINSYIDRNTIHVTVNEVVKARQEILTAASGDNWPLTSFTLNRASLEEMFMKVVNS